MSGSSSGEGDGDSALDSREHGRALTRIDSGMAPPISVPACCKSDGDRSDVLHFCSMRFHGKWLELHNRININWNNASGAWF